MCVLTVPECDARIAGNPRGGTKVPTIYCRPRSPHSGPTPGQRKSVRQIGLQRQNKSVLRNRLRPVPWIGIREYLFERGRPCSQAKVRFKGENTMSTVRSADERVEAIAELAYRLWEERGCPD